MLPVAQILRQHRLLQGYTLGRLALKVGISKSYLSMIENRRVARPPSKRLLTALEQALSLQPGQLLHAADWESTPAWLRAKVSPVTHDADTLCDRNIQPPIAPSAAPIPLINRVAAGYPTGFTDLDYPARIADRYISCPDLDDPQAFAAEVVGDSMLPDYQQGDIVIFSPAAKVEDGCDCFVRLLPHHDTTFKRVFFDPRSPDMIRLVPTNPAFPPAEFSRRKIVGLCRAVRRYHRL